MERVEKENKIFLKRRNFYWNVNKKGQMYLIAAVIIVTIVLGFAAISNYSRTKNTIRLYNLKEDLEIASENVLEYGVYNEYNDEEMQDLIEDFIQLYTEYIGEGIEIYFVYGNRNLITIATYSDLDSIDIEDETILITSGEVTTKVFEPQGNKVVVQIESIEYEFDLKSGENFYFIISQEIGEEEHIVISE
jgi:hypothetical protein